MFATGYLSLGQLFQNLRLLRARSLSEPQRNLSLAVFESPQLLVRDDGRKVLDGFSHCLVDQVDLGVSRSNLIRELDEDAPVRCLR